MIYNMFFKGSNMKKYLKIVSILAVPVLLQGCAWVVHTASCVATVTIIC